MSNSLRLWAVACQAPLSMGPTQGSNPRLLHLLHWQVGSSPLLPPGKPPDGLDSKESAWNAGDPGSFPGLGRSTREGNGYQLQYSCLENSMDKGGGEGEKQSSNMHTQIAQTSFHCSGQKILKIKSTCKESFETAARFHGQVIWFVRLEDNSSQWWTPNHTTHLWKRHGNICLESIMAVQMNGLSHYSPSPLIKQAIASLQMLILCISTNKVTAKNTKLALPTTK